MNRKKLREKGAYLLLGVLTFICCLFVCGKSGVFASKVDWISQHSVLPDYFRQQFYATGRFFPEFAANIGGGQNIYNFAYYGLYSPVVVFSYILPFVKMGDYLMAASIVSLMVTVLLFYHWLLHRGISGEISFLTALIFLLAAPMIYHSYNQIMFVNYMPWLCLALVAVDRYFEQKKIGLYTLSVFLMILTSFYFSIGGMLVLVLYGIFRYCQLQEEEKKTIKLINFLVDGFHFLLPMITAILMSAVLLVPTGIALMGGRSTKDSVDFLELLFPPRVQVFLYSPYGIGLTTLVVTVLLTGLAYKKYYEKLLHLGCLIIITVPLFSYLLNGALYVRDKAMIPFLPLLCYLIAYYMEKQKQREISFPAGCIPFLLTIFLLCLEHKQGEFSKYWYLILLDGILMLLVFLLFCRIGKSAYLIKNASAKKVYLILLIIPILSLCISGVTINQTSDKKMDREFYETVTDPSIKKAIREITEGETGFYRMEQSGTDNTGAANINRIWDMGQYISSVYSSSYHGDYQEFQRKTFMLEQPYRNVLMQPAAKNPIYQRLMGVKYILSDQDIPGYQKYKSLEGQNIYKREDVLPIAYVSDRVISEKAYQNLKFPYNQAVLSEYAIVAEPEMTAEPAVAAELATVEDGENQWDRMENPEWGIRPVELEIPECSEGNCRIEKTKEGYHIQTDKMKNVSLDLQQSGDFDTIFVQFSVNNHKKTEDVSVYLSGGQIASSDSIKNKLTASTHIYYNANERFTYVMKAEEGSKTINFGFDAGDYDISDLQFFVGKRNGRTEKLCQSEFQPDWKRTKGNRITGSITAKNNGYLITSIPYDENFELRLDGKKTDYERVNTAFLGMKIAAGEHQIEMIYHAPGLQTGKFLSVMGLILFLIRCILCDMKFAIKKRNKN